MPETVTCDGELLISKVSCIWCRYLSLQKGYRRETQPAICVMTFLSQSLLVNDRAVCCRLDDRSTFPWSASNNDGSRPPRLTDRPSANNNSGEGWWRLSNYAITGRHSVKIESWSQPGIGSLRFPGHKYLYIIELTVCNVLIVYVCCLGASEFVV